MGEVGPITDRKDVQRLGTEDRHALAANIDRTHSYWKRDGIDCWVVIKRKSYSTIVRCNGDLLDRRSDMRSDSEGRRPGEYGVPLAIAADGVQASLPLCRDPSRI